MADESKDVSKGFITAEGLDAASLFSYILQTITEHGLSNSAWDSVTMEQQS